MTARGKGGGPTATIVNESATTPDGQRGILVRCDCGGHPGGSEAIMRAAAAAGLRRSPVRIHGFVNLAHHPALSRAPQVQANGPWAVTR